MGHGSSKRFLRTRFFQSAFGLLVGSFTEKSRSREEKGSVWGIKKEEEREKEEAKGRESNEFICYTSRFLIRFWDRFSFLVSLLTPLDWGIHGM